MLGIFAPIPLAPAFIPGDVLLWGTLQELTEFHELIEKLQADQRGIFLLAGRAAAARDCRAAARLSADGPAALVFGAGSTLISCSRCRV